MSEPLTAAELLTHERAIAKLRRKLFRRYTAEDYHIIPGTERVCEASVTISYQPWDQQTVRAIKWGGLAFDVEGGDEPEPFKFEVRHWQKDRCYIHVCAMPLQYTRHVNDYPFADLDESLFRIITGCRRVRYSAHYQK